MKTRLALSVLLPFRAGVDPSPPGCARVRGCCATRACARAGANSSVRKPLDFAEFAARLGLP